MNLSYSREEFLKKDLNENDGGLAMIQKEKEEAIKELWDQLGQKIEESGANINVNITFGDKLPDTKSLEKDGSILEKLGNIKQGIVFLVKKVGVVIAVFVWLTSSVPQSYDNIRKWTPEAYDAVCDVIELVKGDTPLKKVREDDTYIVIDPSWQDDKNLFYENRDLINTRDYWSKTSSGATVVASSTFSYDVIKWST